eukprot:TRINITY_DN15638_c0_g1_i1.p2 TRINITY_DN15638_c0_g1~~TRINITY_DN15638_c0_g1_i1.p2  ORF type:complete len:166 (-),score=20.75 TRINITY_DN15638_c0_g1_i1:246-743(-)
MIRRPPRSTLSSSSAASDVYKRQVHNRFPPTQQPAAFEFVVVRSLSGQSIMIMAAGPLQFSRPVDRQGSALSLLNRRQVHGQLVRYLPLHPESQRHRGIAQSRGCISHHQCRISVQSNGQHRISHESRAHGEFGPFEFSPQLEAQINHVQAPRPSQRQAHLLAIV